MSYKVTISDTFEQQLAAKLDALIAVVSNPGNFDAELEWAETSIYEYDTHIEREIDRALERHRGRSTNRR